MDSGIGLGTIVGIIVGIIVFVFGLTYFATAYSCGRKAQATGLETRFDFWGGGEYACLIKVNGKFIPTENWIENSGN